MTLQRAWAFETWSHHAFGLVKLCLRMRYQCLLFSFSANTMHRNVSYWFWGIILLSGILNRLYECYLISGLPKWRYDQEANFSAKRNPQRHLLSVVEPVRHWVRINLILPPAIGDYHQRLLYWCTVPTRIEAMIVTFFYLLSLALTVTGYEVFRGNL